MILTDTRITMHLKMFTLISNDSDTNLINIVNRNINKQLKVIRKEKHKQYLQNTSRKSPLQENIVIKTNEKNDREKTNEEPMIHITKLQIMKLMIETISVVGHQEHVQ